MALTQYPVIDIRETETQIMLENRKTVVIGGLLQERKSVIQSKVPWLGDIPYLGRLFRRDTTDNKTIDLLIFLSATIVNEKNVDTIVAEKGVLKNDGKTIVVSEAFKGQPGNGIFSTNDVPPAAVLPTVPAVDMSGEDK